MKISFIPICLSVLSACATHQSSDVLEIAYSKKGTSVLDVFEMSQPYFSNEDVSYLRKRNRKYGEFGGRIKFCSNDEYLCLNGGIHVAVPRGFSGRVEWAVEGRACKAETPFVQDRPTNIQCNFAGSWTQFVYTPGRGITTYVRSSDPTFTYELVDAKGLFARL